MELTTVALLLLIPLLIWRIYLRLKRMLARQESLMGKHWMSAVAFSVFLVWMAATMADNVLAVSCLGAGALAGAWLGFFGFKTTHFEVFGTRVYFTPNLRIGLAVFMLFAGRMLYRGVELYMSNHLQAHQLVSQKDFVQSPGTTIILGLLAGYCAAYSSLMIRWRQAHKPAPDPEL